MIIDGTNYVIKKDITLQRVFESSPCEGQLKAIIRFALYNSIHSMIEPIKEKVLVEAFESNESWLEYALEQEWLEIKTIGIVMGQVYKDTRLNEYWVFDLDDNDPQRIICHNISDRVIFTRDISLICDEVESETKLSFQTTDDVSCIEAFNHYFGLNLEATGCIIYNIIFARYRRRP